MNKNSCIPEQDHIEKEKSNIKCSDENKLVTDMLKEMKSKYGVSYADKSVKIVKQHPLLRKKVASSANHLTNASAKAVLFERNVEIKDLESKVRYLQNKIKELENENRTLQGVQSRQERELKKFKEGVADIPSLLRAHKEEIKVYESTISGLRKELRDFQKELKLRNEAVLKKDSQIDKLNVIIKRNEKTLQDFSYEIKELKTAKRDLEEENRMLIGDNQNLKNKNDGLCERIKDLCSQVKSPKESLYKEKDVNKQIKIHVEKLQEKNEVEKNNASEDKCNSSEELINCNPGQGDSFEVVPEIVSENEDKGLQISLADESNMKIVQDKQLGDKAKDALIHTLKCYQELYDRNLTGFDSMVSCGIKGSNLKLLPPLNQPSIKHSQDSDAPLFNKEFPSSVDTSLRKENKFSKCNKLLKDSPYKLKTGEFEIDKSVFKEATKRNKCSDFRELSKENNRVQV